MKKILLIILAMSANARAGVIQLAPGSFVLGISSVAVDAVYTDSIQNLAVTNAKINDVAAAKISAGALGSSVIASSVAVASVLNASIVSVSAAKLTAGIIPVTVQVYQSSDCEALTPAAEGEWCYDTTAHAVNVSTSTALGGFSPL